MRAPTLVGKTIYGFTPHIERGLVSSFLSGGPRSTLASVQHIRVALRPVNAASAGAAGNRFIEAKFIVSEPHASGNLGPYKCVVPSRMKTIAWYARLQYRAQGGVPADYADEPGGNLYIKCLQYRTNTLEHHDGTFSSNQWKVLEYFKVLLSGEAHKSDEQGESRDFQGANGVCHIHSDILLLLSLVVCPNATAYSFGTEKYDTTTGRPLPPEEGGSSGSGYANWLSMGEFNPEGWGGIVTQYTTGSGKGWTVGHEAA